MRTPFLTLPPAWILAVGFTGDALGYKATNV